eukprot:TRINITY_DN3613_c0_g1_i1.p1 TRINITY_DN3613_c0_g1~~TRINITY_DN3613_c0_g1_i1.p1  ORF type:complete len:133 (-),score=24.61 TRINITY_DN3613_c0_g1_i1:48-446(-)
MCIRDRRRVHGIKSDIKKGTISGILGLLPLLIYFILMVSTGKSVLEKRNFLLEFILTGAFELFFIFLTTLGVIYHINVHEEREMLEEEEANPEGAPQIEDVAEPSTRKPEFIRSVAYVASVLQQRSGKNKQG